MATSGSVRADFLIGGHSSERCPLCGRAPKLATGELTRSRICPDCGLDFRRLENLCEKKSPPRASAKSAPPASDPLDRWLSGEPMVPQRLNDWQRASVWVRQHPRLIMT